MTYDKPILADAGTVTNPNAGTALVVVGVNGVVAANVYTVLNANTLANANTMANYNTTYTTNINATK